MAFDQTTRNRLQRLVNDARRVLEEEFTRQLQNDFGLDPNAGAVAELARLRHIDDAQRETARILRDTLAHYTASGDMNASQGLDRIVREQAFTVLNRLAALRMAEARGLLVESVGNGFQSKGFQLYARLAGTGLGETGDAYRVYLFSVFDELAQDLPGLFDRYSPQGRLFPREAALLQVLNLINDADIAPLWREDETIGWIYQYFQLQGRAQGHAQCQPGTAQQPRAGGAQPVLHPALRGRVPGGQHTGPAVVQRHGRANLLARALPIPAGETRCGAPRRHQAA
jgi:hypothetical protein